jgi:hypothetical protein
VSWQAATATAAYSCDLTTTTALIHRLGSGWRRQRRSGPDFVGDGLQICLLIFGLFSLIGIIVFGSFYIGLVEFVIRNNRPVNSAYFFKCLTVCRFYPPALLSFFYVLSL